MEEVINTLAALRGFRDWIFHIWRAACVNVLPQDLVRNQYYNVESFSCIIRYGRKTWMRMGLEHMYFMKVIHGKPNPTQQP